MRENERNKKQIKNQMRPGQKKTRQIRKYKHKVRQGRARQGRTE